MSSKFFTNRNGNSLLTKFEGVFTNLVNLYAFHAVVGYFRASGYFAIREYLLKIPEVKILVGINVDKLSADAQRRGLLFDGNDEKTRDEFVKWMQQDIKEARYAKEVEQGVLTFMQDVMDKKIELRAHKSQKLHSKIYVFLPQGFNEHTDGRVITGSSNLTDAGLGSGKYYHNYEFNVELREFTDVSFAENEFQELWKESTPILPADLTQIKDKSHLDKEFKPFELYIKFLIEYFGRNIEYDPETVGDVPSSFKKLSYQVDAVNEGYQMLMDHNGFILADVVGTGKTVMATMLAKRFIIANGTAHTKILVIYPPALEKSWKRTFKQFGIDRYAKFVSNGSLDKIIKEDINYWTKEEYDLVLVDEAHRFRNHQSQAFQNLQIICKAGRLTNGIIEGNQKKVVLISATPLNNHPRDLYYLLSLFQNIRRSTLPETNLQRYFGRAFDEYRHIQRTDPPDMDRLRTLYTDIRERIVKPITIRRTRADLTGTERYRQDLDDQGIRFPDMADPVAIQYQMSPALEQLFYTTILCLTDADQIQYMRYQAITQLEDRVREEYYPLYREQSAFGLAGIMRTRFVKRLESSFYAFKQSLGTFHSATKFMLQAYQNGKVFISPDLDINYLLEKGLDEEEIEEAVLELSDTKPGNRVFNSSDFKPTFAEGLQQDLTILTHLCEAWEQVEEDPKWDKFRYLLENELFAQPRNREKKLVVFSESKDTSDYLVRRMREAGFTDMLAVSAENRKALFECILENFDANYDRSFKNDYNIIVTTEVLAEGVNLHRSNVIVNYDTPWNATRLMQRIGRVNRIGSKAPTIYNYNFYPSAQGDGMIELYKKSYLKLQGFHTVFGEDARVYTLEEIIEQFRLFNQVGEQRDIRLEYLEFIRKFRADQPDEFRRIKKLPRKARTGRRPKTNDESYAGSSICFVQNDFKKELYLTDNNHIRELTFEEAVRVFEAQANEESVTLPEFHFEHISRTVRKFDADMQAQQQPTPVSEQADARTNYAKAFLRQLHPHALTDQFEVAYRKLIPLLDEGTYINLTIDLDRLRRESQKRGKLAGIEQAVIKIAEKYTSKLNLADEQPEGDEKPQKLLSAEPEIIISETFTK
ncbi:helicase-related protein (plasmid) [Spirosoma sp. SC4-14]|uniref:helicase-related protein n=1 Tax=Spirosoma sp. SC4-14 TaxID=3128900 RepID=UPI0030D6240B